MWNVGSRTFRVLEMRNNPAPTAKCSCCHSYNRKGTVHLLGTSDPETPELIRASDGQRSRQRRTRDLLQGAGGGVVVATIVVAVVAAAAVLVIEETKVGGKGVTVVEVV